MDRLIGNSPAPAEGLRVLSYSSLPFGSSGGRGTTTVPPSLSFKFFLLIIIMFCQYCSTRVVMANEHIRAETTVPFQFRALFLSSFSFFGVWNLFFFTFIELTYAGLIFFTSAIITNGAKQQEGIWRFRVSGSECFLCIMLQLFSFFFLLGRKYYHSQKAIVR